MKHFIASFIFSLLSTAATSIFSQPVLSKEDIQPRIGEFYYFSLTNEPDTIHKVKGPGVTWMYTCCPQPSNTQILTVKDPSDTPFYTHFPGTDFCVITKYISSNYTNYSYQEDREDLITEHGEVFEYSSGVDYAIYDQLHDLLQFPLHYGDSIQHSYHGEATRPGSKTTYPRHGQRTCMVDGYGTLIYTIGDTIQDVVRMTCKDYHVDSLPQSYDSSYSTVISWFKAGIRAPLIVRTVSALLSYNWVDQSYTGISGNYYKYQDPDAVLMQLTAIEPSMLSVANDFIAYPNPSADHHITFSGETNMDEIVIFNTLGSMIYEAKPKATSITVSLQDPGIYFAKLLVGGQSFWKEIVIGN